jgi:hypothetical protein
MQYSSMAADPSSLTFPTFSSVVRRIQLFTSWRSEANLEEVERRRPRTQGVMIADGGQLLFRGRSSRNRPGQCNGCSSGTGRPPHHNAPLVTPCCGSRYRAPRPALSAAHRLHGTAAAYIPRQRPLGSPMPGSSTAGATTAGATTNR